MLENKFFVSVQGGSAHEPEKKISFLSHVPRVLSQDDAVNLVANICVLLDEAHMKAIGAAIDKKDVKASNEFPKLVYDHSKKLEAPSHVRLVRNEAEQKAAEADGYQEDAHPGYDHGLRQEQEEAKNAVEEKIAAEPAPRN